jgi:hypothetical protein
MKTNRAFTGVGFYQLPPPRVNTPDGSKSGRLRPAYEIVIVQNEVESLFRGKKTEIN